MWAAVGAAEVSMDVTVGTGGPQRPAWAEACDLVSSGREGQVRGGERGVRWDQEVVRPSWGGGSCVGEQCCL